jgi:hypothetical protein
MGLMMAGAVVGMVAAMVVAVAAAVVVVVVTNGRGFVTTYCGVSLGS